MTEPMRTDVVRRLVCVTFVGMFGTTLLLGPSAGLGYADPPPPVDPAAPQDDPPPPPPPSIWLSGTPNIYQGFPTWPAAFPKCWPPWEPPGAEAPPPGDPRYGYFGTNTVQYTPCPAPPPPPEGQAYPPPQAPPAPWPPCGWQQWPIICFPGQAEWGPLPPGYYGPPSWYQN